MPRDSLVWTTNKGLASMRMLVFIVFSGVVLGIACSQAVSSDGEETSASRVAADTIFSSTPGATQDGVQDANSWGGGPTDAGGACGDGECGNWESLTCPEDCQGLEDASNGSGANPEDGVCDCSPTTHCDESGLCQPDVCVKGTTTCVDLETVKQCSEDGASFTTMACADGEICYGGVCWPPICEPGEGGLCQEGDLLICNSLGTDWVTYPCPAGQGCLDGICQPIPPNVIMLIDTSGSMNWMDNGESPDKCVGSSCPVWSMPNCDSGAIPLTRLGKVKVALQSVIESDAAQNLRIALQRFPQIPYSAALGLPCVEGFGCSGGANCENMTAFGLGTCGPACDGGYWGVQSEVIVMSGDDGSHLVSSTGWFAQNLGEILPMPFEPSGPTELDVIGEWIDGAETVQYMGGTCTTSADCGGGPCLTDGCYQHLNPELRAVGATPLGKSLFYAGEYLRNFELVEGRKCTTDADCGTANHLCEQGLCHDPHAYCRSNIIIVFSDGEETENVHLTDFFHPRVQAKRLHYGLGCQDDLDCLSGAICELGVCVPPEGVIDESIMACETGGTSCASTADCPDPCADWGGCQGYCSSPLVNTVDGAGSDHIFDQSGVATPVTVHVVDASGVPGKNHLVAAYGGGKHFSVDLADPEALVTAVNELIGDAKAVNPCAQPSDDP